MLQWLQKEVMNDFMIIYICALQSSHLHIQQPFLFIYLFFSL